MSEWASLGPAAHPWVNEYILFLLCAFLFISAILANKKLLRDFNSQLEYLLPKILELSPKDTDHADEIITAIKEFYFNGSDIVSQENREGFMKVSHM